MCGLCFALFLLFFPVMEDVSWDKISSPPRHAVQHVVNALLRGVFSMPFICCLKGELVVVHILVVVLFSFQHPE